MKKWFMSFIIVVGLICLVGVGYSEATGSVQDFNMCFSNVCYSPTTGDAVVETAGGDWQGALRNTPGSWVESPMSECNSGKLVKVGTFLYSDFALNSYGYYQTAPFSLTLGPGEYIAKVMLNGAWRRSFCLYFYDTSSGKYSTLGCEDSAAPGNNPATFSFVPLQPVPPSDFTTPFSLVGTNGIFDSWGPSTAEEGDPPVAFDGSLSCWVCVQRAHP